MVGCREDGWVQGRWLGAGKVVGCREDGWVQGRLLGAGKMAGCREGGWVQGRWLGAGKMAGCREDGWGQEGKFPNCQMYRQESRFADNLPEMTDMWFDADGEPFLVGCQFTPDPPIGQLSPLNVTVVYKGIDITRLPEVTDGSNYCSQNIYLFCADSLPELTGVYGFYHRGQKIQDAEMRVLSEEEGAALCDDPLFSDKCNNCPGQRPRGLSIIDKSMVPVTDIVLPPDSGVTLAIDDATCGNIEKDCDAILKAGREEEILEDGTYVIDPDQGGPLPPFKVECDFIEGTGVTNVAVDERWTDGSVGASSDDSGFPFRFEATYPTATPEQVNSLTENSEFCWQGVKYECQGSAIYNDGNMDTVLSLNGEPSTSFGTGSNSEYLGCACGLLGTCETKDVTCNCDAKGPMTEDRGFITDPAALPVTAIDINTPPTGSGRVTVTSVRCAPTPVDLPESCEEAYEWGQASANGKVNGVDFTVSGPYLVSPGDVEPFLVYCDFTSEPGNPITVVKPEPTNDEPVDDADEEVDYRGPTDEQLQALISVSGNCYQPVRVDCYAAKFLDGGVSFSGASGASSNEWNALGQAMCTCGVDGQCGGTESYTQQKNTWVTKCNCDLGDDVHRRDSAILTVKSALPLRQLYTGAVPAGGQLNLTVGDLVCARDPLDFDECATGFNDCADEAVCRNTADGFECSCPAGWQGRTATKSDDDPIANGRQCIDDDECAGGGPCPWNAKCVNTPGSFACECNRGFRNSGPLTCVDIDECTEEGDHEPCDPNARCINSIGSYRCFCKRGYRGDGFKCFRNFDGKWNHYQGQCTYTVAQGNCDNNDTLPTFKVTADNWDRDYGIADIAWIKDVKVEVYGDVIEIKQGRKVFVNGVKRRYYKRLNADRTSVMLRVARIGLRVELFTDFGLEVFADGQDQLEVMVPDNLQGSMCGLCGNYNGDPEDDWTIGPAEESCNVDCDAPEPEERCDHPDAAKEQCDKFFDNSESPFNECIEKMPAEMLTQMQYSCTFDMCRVPSMTDALCEFGEAMASMCEDILSGAVIEWRSEYCTGTVECEMNEEYKECGPTIEPTCDAQDMVQEEQCRFNCYCQEGYMREMGECIHKDECGCLYGDVKMEIGDSMLTDDCSNMVVCMSHNNTDEQPHSCGANEVCSMTDGGEEECVCDDDSTMNPETGLCESPVTGDCEDVELKYFYDTNVLNIDNLDGGEVIIPRTPTETFKVTYMVDDGDFASFEAVKFKLIGGDAQTVRVFAVGENPRDTLEVVSASDVNRDQEITLTFTLSPRGKRLRFVVVPKNDIPCLVILETRLCLEESPDTAPITSDAVQCSEVTGNTPQLGPKFKDNVIDIDLTDAGDIITPKFPDSKYTVVYKRLDGESATFRSITYKLNGNAKRVSVWVVNDGPEDEVTTENRLDVQADQEINVVFEEMPIGRKIRVAVIPYDGQTAPSLTIVNIEVCDEPVDEPVTDTVTTCMEEGKINPATYVHFTSNVESVDRSQAADRITPADRDSRFVATYAIEDYQEATFSGMTYRLSGGGAKRVAVYTLRNVQPDQNVRVDFAEMPEGKKVRIAVIPNDGQPAPDLEVVNIEACVVPSQPVPSSAAVCEETGMANDPGMAIDYTSNVANIDQPAGEGEVISPADVTGKMKVSYAAENYEDATFRSVKFRVLNGNAKRVTVWVVGDNPLDERDMQQSNNVSPADGDITVEFSAQPVGRKLRIVVVPNDGENVPSLQVLSVDVCDGHINECEIGEHTCVHLGQVCVNTEGSFQCECQDGYEERDGYCHDINECDEVPGRCGPHSQCKNMLGTFDCACCMGYEKNGAECQRVPGTPLYGGPGEECCACTGDSCDNTEPVCATDGQSYPNYKAMVEAGCRKNVTLRVSYKGSCEDDCGAVQCEGMKVCINSGPGGVGQCECEGCGGGGASETSGEVCASNGKTYPSECFFNLVKCETGNDDLSLASDSEPCEGGSGGPQVSQWGPWSPCSETCGAGSKTRTRTALRETSFALEQTVLCYTTCPEGLCQDDTCSNPGQVCLKGQCMCPDCQGWLSDPVCGLVGDTVKTYDNECQMQREACQLTKNFIKLEDQACENKPRDCGLIRYFARLTDDNGCVSDGVENIGLCYGGCEKMGECCRPDPDVPRSSVSLSYTCPNGEIITRQVCMPVRRLS
ncbi:hypothetical protein BaRGS_00013082 [Batillaria attramentaria]|uniref:Uncharacterized protein n=1 Tax=Batillaria attramentaria TaxID=370345 RepID=A0ABD0L8F7_9CAEN